MAKKSFYIDSCIWLNLFKKEGDQTKGVPYWFIAKTFIERVMLSDNEIVYSGFVLKELKFKLDDALFKEKLHFFKEAGFKFIKATEQDYSLAREIETELDYGLSFFDCLHIALCKRLACTLVTRDLALIAFAKKHISADLPEKLII